MEDHWQIQAGLLLKYLCHFIRSLCNVSVKARKILAITEASNFGLRLYMLHHGSYKFIEVRGLRVYSSL